MLKPSALLYNINHYVKTQCIATEYHYAETQGIATEYHYAKTQGIDTLIKLDSFSNSGKLWSWRDYISGETEY